MIATEDRAWLLACVVLGAVLACLVSTGCGAPRRPVVPTWRDAQRDGAWREQARCEASQSASEFERCARGE